MKLDETSIKPIYVQIAEAIEDEILSGNLSEGGPCYSQLVIAKELRVNPATAAKGITHLVTMGILEKKRGQAMTVMMGAKEIIVKRKKKEELAAAVKAVVDLAKKLGVSMEEVYEEMCVEYGEAK